MEDPRQGGGNEPIGPVVQAERCPDVQELAEGPRVEGDGDLGGEGLGRAAPGAAPGGRHEGPAAVWRGRGLRQGDPVGCARRPAEAEGGDARRGLGP